MSVRMLTGGLLGVLADLAQTVDRDPEADVLDGVLLHTTRGHHGDEPGRTDLLAGASTDRYVVGHTYTWCTGQLAEPTLWSLRHVRNVLTVFKAARGKDKEGTHAVEIRTYGGEVEIREDPNLIDDGVKLTFAEGDAARFPARTVYTMLDVKQPDVIVRDGVFVDAGPSTDLTPRTLIPFLRVAARRHELLRLYRTHQHVPVLVQVGPTCRGLLMPYKNVEDGGDRPAVELYGPDLDHPRWARPVDQAPPEDADPVLDLDLAPADVDDDPGDTGDDTEHDTQHDAEHGAEHGEEPS